MACTQENAGSSWAPRSTSFVCVSPVASSGSISARYLATNRAKAFARFPSGSREPPTEA